MKKIIALSMIRLLLLIACTDIIAVEINPAHINGVEHFILNSQNKPEVCSSSGQGCED